MIGLLFSAGLQAVSGKLREALATCALAGCAPGWAVVESELFPDDQASWAKFTAGCGRRPTSPLRSARLFPSRRSRVEETQAASGRQGKGWAGTGGTRAAGAQAPDGRAGQLTIHRPRVVATWLFCSEVLTDARSDSRCLRTHFAFESQPALGRESLGSAPT